MRILNASSKFVNDSFVARKVLCGTLSVSDPPTIIPSAAFHHCSSPARTSQPVSDVPSKSERESAAEADGRPIATTNATTNREARGIGERSTSMGRCGPARI